PMPLRRISQAAMMRHSSCTRNDGISRWLWWPQPMMPRFTRLLGALAPRTRAGTMAGAMAAAATAPVAFNQSRRLNAVEDAGAAGDGSEGWAAFIRKSPLPRRDTRRCGVRSTWRVAGKRGSDSSAARPVGAIAAQRDVRSYPIMPRHGEANPRGAGQGP